MALSTWNTEVSTHAVPSISVVGSPSVTVFERSGIPRVRFSVTYTVPHLLFVGWFSSTAGGGTYTYASTAFVCTPGKNVPGLTQGACQRPG